MAVVIYPSFRVLALYKTLTVQGCLWQRRWHDHVLGRSFNAPFVVIAKTPNDRISLYFSSTGKKKKKCRHNRNNNYCCWPPSKTGLCQKSNFSPRAKLIMFYWRIAVISTRRAVNCYKTTTALGQETGCVSRWERLLCFWVLKKMLRPLVKCKDFKVKTKYSHLG